MQVLRRSALTLSFLLPWGCSGDDGTQPPQTESGESGQDLAVVPGQKERIALNKIAYKYDYLDPEQDGWNTEVLAAKVKEHLHRIEEALHNPHEIEASDLAAVATGDFTCTNLTGKLSGADYDAGGIVVVRGAFPSGPLEGTGAAVLAAAVVEFADQYTEEVQAHFRVVRIDAPELGADFTTDLRLELSGRTASGRGQQTAEWSCTWRPVVGEDLPRLAAIVPTLHESVIAKSETGEPLFEDCTEAVLAGDESYAAQLLRSQRDSATELDKELGMAFRGNFGLAVGDVNGDRRDDLYVCMEGGLPNRLYVQQEDGTARDVAAEAGLDYLDRSRSVLFVDLDDDGDQDCVVSTYPVTIHENVGEGRFERRAEAPLANVYSMASADFDQDGDLDLYLCRYNAHGTDLPLPYHDANNGLDNVLLRNEGSWKFADATQAIGLDDNNERFSFAASWVDYDDDGDLDLYVANDYGRNNLYKNTRGTFHDAAAEAGAEDISAGMSVCWGDANADGRSDLYVSNMFSPAGNRIAFQRNFREGDDADLASFQRHARGNSLFVNQGDGTFVDTSVDAGVTMARWAWGSIFSDLNNDGLEDLYAVNGFITNEDTGDL
ncbi:MAG: VCBS repeat-containing protein [bacterium]|nr:VCBS repeat-containing protein [bacterium]